MALLAGTRLGVYEIGSPLGVGGMGEVYRARDPRLGREVAIKVLPAEFSPDADRLRRFEQEARAAAALNHPNILAVYDIGTHDGSPYIVAELLDGQTLRERLREGPLAVRPAVEYARQLTCGLVAAHAKGIVHRDLKPDNVFVTRDGRVKILDFGLAKTGPVAGCADVTRAPQTLEGAVLGTVGYMAPEQLRGEPVDARADIFAVGVIVHELITGQTPFRRTSAAETMTAVLREDPPDLAVKPGAPAPLASIVRRCLEKDPINRFQTACDLGFALETTGDVTSTPRAKTEVEDRSIAVLPFANMSADPDSEYFSDGLAEELINALTHLPGLRVASRTSAFRFRGRDVDIKEIGRALSVATVLEGSVRRMGPRLRVTAQLINVADGYHRWSERYDREMADVFEIQDDIVASIIKALAPALIGEAKTAVKRPTENLEAYELYLKGRQYWHQRSPVLMPIAIRSFEQAIALDLDYTLAYAGLADCHSILRAYGRVSEATSRPPAEAALKRAITLDPMLSEVQFSQALFIINFERRWRRAERYLRRAIELNPRSSLACMYYGLFLAAAYRPDEASAQVRVALDLDPLSPYVHAQAALALYMGSAYPEAERLARRALDLQPDYVLGLGALASVLTLSRRVAEAIPVAERLVALSRTPMFVSALAMMYGLAGRTTDLTHLEHELDERRSGGEYIAPFSQVQFAIGRADGALIRHALGECFTDPTPFGPLRALVGPFLDAWRTDKAIDELLQRLGDGVRPPSMMNTGA
jgi:serine/threonine protein kinase/tetratricopeptide (TPR) repeat protein